MTKEFFQKELYELTVENFDKTIQLFHQLQIPISEISSLLFDSVSIKPQNAELYLSFYSSILPANNEKFNNQLNFIILQNVLNTHLTSEKVFFIFLLFENGIISLSHIIQIYSSIRTIYLPLFLIFLPEIYQSQYQSNFIKNITSSLNVDIEQNINDDWKQFKLFRHQGQNPDPVLQQIRLHNHHDIEDLNAHVPFSIFERSSLLRKATYLEYLIYFNHPDSTTAIINNGDRILFEKLAAAAIFGENISFFTKFSEEILGFDTLIEKSKNEQFIEMEENENNWTIKETENKTNNASDSFDSNLHILTISEINGRVYANKECCLKSLNNWAYRQGFKLVKIQATKAKVLQLRCYLGKRHKNGNSDTKSDNSDCCFKISISERKDSTCKVRVQEKNQSHNHQLNPSLTQHFLFPNEIIETIKVLRKGTVAVTPGIISKYVQLVTGVVIKANQIDELSNLKNDESINNEIQELIDFLDSTNGKTEIIKQNDQIIGLLAFTSESLSNIVRYGEVMSIERIENFQNKYNCIAYEVYGINFDFEIVSFGSLYLVNNEIHHFKLILNAFLNFVSTRRKIETLITGNEIEMMDSIHLVRNTSHSLEGSNHVINANYIMSEFRKNLFIVDENKRKSLIKAIEKVIFSKSETIYRENLSIMMNLSDNFSQFVKKSLPNSSNYARYEIRYIKTFGLNYISIRKNISNLFSITYPNKYVTLLECNKVLSLDLNTSLKKFTLIDRTNYFEFNNDMKDLPPNLGENVAKFLLNEVQKANNLDAVLDDTKSIVNVVDNENKESFIVSLKNNLSNSNLNALEISCSCQSTLHIGLPCSHLIKAYQFFRNCNADGQIQAYPWSYISTHFLNENKRYLNFGPNWPDCQLNLDLDSHINSLTISQSEIDFNHSTKDNDSVNNNEKLSNGIHLKRFNEMMNAAKEAAKICIYTDEDKDDFISLIHNFSAEKTSKYNK